MKNDIVVIYDGECGFCNRSVLFLLKRDKHESLGFSANKSRYSVSALTKFGILREASETLVLVEHGEAYTYSDAALRITRYLKFPWSLLIHMLVVPKKVRDPVYKWIARNRHRISGSTKPCRIPDKSIMNRFIED